MTEHNNKRSSHPGRLARLRKAFGIGGLERDIAQSKQRSRNRRSEAGNVFFTLFGAVAVVGVLGAGIMSTMRGPLTTMVEINRIEEAKSQMRLNARLVLQDASSNSHCGATDDVTADPAATEFTEARPWSGGGSPGPSDGGLLPGAIGASQTDPWGQTYGYCVWNNGASNTGCTDTLDGANDPNAAAIALITGGPDRAITTTCAQAAGGGKDNDDLIEVLTYAEAVTGSGGLWTDAGADATINKNIDVTGEGTFSGKLNVTSATDSTFTAGASFGNDIVTTGDVITNSIQSLTPGSDPITITATSTNLDSNLVVNGTNTTTLNGATTINDDLAVTGATDLQGTLNVNGNIANDNGTDPITINDTLNVTGLADFDSGTNIDGDITSDADGVVNINDALDVTGDVNVNGNIANDNGTDPVAINDDLSITGDIVTDTVINSTTNDGSTNPITLYQSDGTTEVFAVDSLGNVSFAGNLSMNGAADAGKILIADGTTGVFTPQTMGADATIADNGDVTIANDAITNAKMANDAVDTAELVDDAVTAAKIKDGEVDIEELAATASGSDLCLKSDGTTGLKFEICSGSGGGDGVGSDGFVDLADTPGAYAAAAADADKLVVVNGTGDGLIFTDASSIIPPSDRLIDAPDAVQVEAVGDTYIDVDTTDNGQTNSIVFVNDGTTNMTIQSNGQVDMAGSMTVDATVLTVNATTDLVSVGGNLAVDTSVLFVDSATNDNVGIGTATPEPTAILDITSTTKGILPPRMKLAQRDTMTTAGTFDATQQGMTIFATDAGDAGLLQFWDGTDWVDVGGGGAEGAGIWAPDDGGESFIEYSDALGGMRVGRITGQAAPAIDWTLDTANSVVFTSNKVAIGSSTISAGLTVDITGNIGATNYCADDGSDCFTAADIDGLMSGSGSLWTDNTQYITRENFHILNAGETTDSAGLNGGVGNALIWDQDKGSLRAGSATAAQWDNSNIGSNSFAFGIDTRASGNNGSVALGSETVASGAWGSFAAGDRATASAAASMATGISTTASGQGSAAFNGETTASGTYSLSAGLYSEASGSNSIATGSRTVASGINSMAMGKEVIAGSGTAGDGAGDGSMAIGLIDDAVTITTSPQVSGTQSLGIFMGDQSGVDLNATQTMGLFGGKLLIDPAVPATQLTARGAIDVGAATDAIVLPSGTVAQRPGTGVDGMLRFNSDNDAYEVYSSTAGDWVQIVSGGSPGLWTDLGSGRIHYGTAGTEQVGIGTNNPVTALDVNGGVRVGSVSAAPPTYLALNSLSNVDTAPSDGECLVYDTGSGNWVNEACDDPSSALWTDNTTHISREDFHILNTGETTATSGLDAVNQGLLYHTDKKALSVGGPSGGGQWDEGEIGTYSLAYGYTTRATGSHSLAGGKWTRASGINSVAFGQQSAATASYTMAVGSGTAATAPYAIALGRRAFVTGARGIAFGNVKVGDGNTTSYYNTGGTASDDTIGEGSMGFGLVTEANDPATPPIITGDESLGIFMGDQSGVNITDSQVMSVMGGKVGIGTVSPNTELHVVGDIQYTGTLTDISDRRLKTDITPLGAEDMIARLSAVDTYTFRMKGDESGRVEYGVMAQELEEIFPELVNTADDEMGTKSVNYTGLIAPMIEATKALKTENDALKAELDAVKAQQKLVLATLETMQSDMNGMKVHTGYGIEKGNALALLILLLSLGGMAGTLLVQRQKQGKIG